DLLKQHVLRLNEFIKKNGKKTIYWGGFQGPPQDADMRDCISYSWHSGARQAQDAGMTTITVPWEIHGPYEKWNIFSSNRDMLKRTDSVLGGARVAWEQSAEAYVNGCIYEALRQEGTWAVDTVTASLKELQQREKTCAAQLGRLLRPVTFHIEGTVEDKTYSGPLTISLPGEVPAGCGVHYTMDGTEPTVRSARYEKPFTAKGSLRPRAAIFDEASGEAISGYVFGPKVAYRDFEQSLSTGKPVTTSGGVNPKEKPENANDGWVDIAKFWGTTPAPQWWQVDLQKEYRVDRVHVYPYWDGVRYYQYTVEVSPDGTTWRQVVDASKNTTTGTEKGYLHTFEPVPARYVKVNVLKNSDNRAVHLVEVRVYEAGK
ncbi:MAG: discoidin domain-containing protein, partial [Planctomycetota bacterium]|nr:discoidin domain-containing protein [Planctomycetota bacterium]